MAKNWAIVVGINQYNPNNFRPLDFARQDAELMQDFFLQEAKFDQVCFFADGAPDLRLPNGTTIPAEPTYGNLISFLHDRFETKPSLSTGDNCWFFFAGHGAHTNRDYLMPKDANPRAIEQTAISVRYVRERLERSGADNVILILDACRTGGDRSGVGIGDESQRGAIEISACRPTEKSWEIEELQHGAFTYALWEALQIPGERNCATVERLSQYLRIRVPELCRQYQKFPEQHPSIATDPTEKSHFILLPKYATLDDVAPLRNAAYRAFVDDDLNLAEQLCVRAIAAAMGRDMDVLNLYVRVKQQKAAFPQQLTQRPEQSAASRDFVVSPPKAESPPVKVQPTPAKPQEPEDDLSSEKGVNYRKLRDLLQAGKWKEADKETWIVMCQAANRQKEGWLQSQDIEKFPCTDLRTIDQLWVRYSEKHFGFSVQKKIWQECGSPQSTGTDWNRFCVKVCWQQESTRYVDYSDLKFDTQKSPKGELPMGLWGIFDVGDGGGLGNVRSLLARKDCEL